MISFAGEQRSEAEAIAACLTDLGIKVFYDAYEQAGLWGKNLYDHLADVYQNEARYCLMLVSTAYAAKVWTNHERINAQARALSQKGEYILPVRFDETEIPGLAVTVGYVRFQDHGVQGICNLLRQKLCELPKKSEAREMTKPTITPCLSQFAEQRKRFTETAVIRKTWANPHWRIWICPTQFRKARYRDIEDCRQFMSSSHVHASGWHSYPWFSSNSIEIGDEWVAGETDTIDCGVSLTERWVLCRNGQFVHNRAVDTPRLGGRIHVLEVLDTATGAVEPAARIAHRGILSPEALITFELRCIDGCALTWPVGGYQDAVGQESWCQEDHVVVGRQLAADDLRIRPRALALEFALEICHQFGWHNPPTERLASEQQQRFGSPRLL